VFDCDGNVLDCASECGGAAVDVGCGCGQPGPSGCDNACGSTLEFDECGACGGDGIADGACDCDGNVDLGCGCGEAGPSGCDETCGSTLEFDECGVCGGDDSSCAGCMDPLANNYDDEATLSDGSCVYDSGPVAFEFNISTSQTHYYFESATIDNLGLESDDWVGAFNGENGDGTGDICVGAKAPTQSSLSNTICGIFLMGVDEFNENDTQDYMQNGDIPVFMVYDQSANEFYDAKVFNNTTGYDFAATDFPWVDFSDSSEFYVISDLGVFVDCNLDLGGHAFIDSCNYCVEGNTGKISIIFF
jgi:hypothetical protein